MEKEYKTSGTASNEHEFAVGVACNYFKAGKSCGNRRGYCPDASNEYCDIEVETTPTYQAVKNKKDKWGDKKKILVLALSHYCQHFSEVYVVNNKGDIILLNK